MKGSDVRDLDEGDAEMDLRRLESLFLTGGAKAFYGAIRDMAAGRPCPDAKGVDY